MKQESEFEIFIDVLYILFGIVFIVFIFVESFIILSHPNFTIYKEECWKGRNETLRENYHFLIEEQYRGGCVGWCNKELSYLNCVEFSKEKCLKLKKEEELIHKKMWDNLIQICEKKEVEEIEDFSYSTTAKECEIDKFKKNCPKEALVELSENIEWTCCYKNLFKKDLSISWLDENCECSDCEDKEGFPTYPEYSHLCGKDRTESGEKINLNEGECSKYKCSEDYIIEVNK